MNKLLNHAQLFCKRNGSTILTCIGSIGVVATTVMAVKATPKALERLEEAKKEKGEELTKFEKVKAAGSVYIPTVVTGTVTIVCIFGANVLNQRNQAALAGAYAFIDNSYKEYKKKLVELHGEEMHQEIIDAIAAEKAENVGINSPGFIKQSSLYVDEQCGETRLFYIECEQRFFEATLEQVISAEYHTNRNYSLRGYSVLNEFYEFLGLEPTEYGDEVGWCSYDEFTFWIDFNNRKTEINGLECVVIDMPYGPDMEWKEYYCY